MEKNEERDLDSLVITLSPNPGLGLLKRGKLNNKPDSKALGERPTPRNS